MNKINANKKLELVKAIRMQNQYNRQLFRARENFLYSDTAAMGPAIKHGELYGLEADEKAMSGDRDAAVSGGFKTRLVIAMILLLSFIVCDINHISYEGENTDTLFGQITENMDLTEVLSFMERE